MSSPSKEFSHKLRECRKNLVVVRERLDGVKRKYLDTKRCPDSEGLRKSAEELESDLAFSSSLLEGLRDPCTAAGFLRRIITGTVSGNTPGSELSWPFRTTLLATTDDFLQDKVASLETLAREMKGRKRKTRARKDFNQSSEQSEESFQSMLRKGKLCSEACYHMKDDGRSERPWRQQMKPKNVCYFTCIERKSEKSVQTDSVQTEDPGRSWIMGEILEALKKINEDYLASNRSSDFSIDRLSVATKVSDWQEAGERVENAALRKTHVAAEDGITCKVPSGAAGTKHLRTMKHRILRLGHEGAVFPKVFQLKEEFGRVEWVGGVSVKMARYMDTLHINHSHQPGTIVLMDYRESPTQSEIIGRIVGYLIGLPPSHDKT